MFKVTINRLIRKQRYFCKNERNSNDIINYKNPVKYSSYFRWRSIKRII